MIKTFFFFFCHFLSALTHLCFHVKHPDHWYRCPPLYDECTDLKTKSQPSVWRRVFFPVMLNVWMSSLCDLNNLMHRVQKTVFLVQMKEVVAMTPEFAMVVGFQRTLFNVLWVVGQTPFLFLFFYYFMINGSILNCWSVSAPQQLVFHFSEQKSFFFNHLSAHSCRDDEFLWV